MLPRRAIIEAQLRAERDKLRGILSSLREGLAIIGRDYRIEFQNEFSLERFGDLRGKLCYEGYMGRSEPCESCPMVKAMQTNTTQSMELVSADGRHYEVTSTPFIDTDGETKAIEVVRDVTERKRAEDALRESERRYRLLAEKMTELSITDELTGLYNRRHFYEMIETEMHRTQRYGRSFSLVILDVDGFKEYNDRFGHTCGDAVLQSLAQTLKSTLRKSDTVFRYGGDEFTIILPATDADRAKKIIDRIRAKWLQTPKVQYPILETPLGFSAGIAQFPENAETADGLVFLADTALYHAKREGGYRATLVSKLEALSTDVLSAATLNQVYALAATVDAKDPFTYGHSKGVAKVAEMIGSALGLSKKELADLRAASLLHDIGKVGVPDSILTKPGALTEDEWGIIKKHSAEGARIVGYVKELRALVPLILHHHEWHDGAGYPDGLKREDIPLGARVISVADAYDTMTTPRSYREVISHEEALEEFRRYSGTQFDPELVEALSRAMNEATRSG